VFGRRAVPTRDYQCGGQQIHADPARRATPGAARPPPHRARTNTSPFGTPATALPAQVLTCLQPCHRPGRTIALTSRSISGFKTRPGVLSREDRVEDNQPWPVGFRNLNVMLRPGSTREPSPEPIPTPNAAGDRNNRRCRGGSDVATARRSKLKASVRSLVVIVPQDCCQGAAMTRRSQGATLSQQRTSSGQPCTSAAAAWPAAPVLVGDRQLRGLDPFGHRSSSSWRSARRPPPAVAIVTPATRPNGAPRCPAC
jgi:hypothetical protein